MHEIVGAIKDSGVREHYKIFFKEKLYSIKKIYYNPKMTPGGAKDVEASPEVVGLASSDVDAADSCLMLLVLLLIEHPDLLLNDDVYSEFCHIDFISKHAEYLELVRGVLLDFKYHCVKNNISPTTTELEVLLENRELSGSYSFIREKMSVTGSFVQASSFEGDNVQILWLRTFNQYKLVIMKREFVKLQQLMTEQASSRASYLLNYIHELQGIITAQDQKLQDCL
jgi:hypothetical protein